MPPLTLPWYFVPEVCRRKSDVRWPAVSLVASSNLPDNKDIIYYMRHERNLLSKIIIIRSWQKRLT